MEDSGYVQWLIGQLAKMTDAELVAVIEKDSITAMDNMRRLAAAVPKADE